MTEEIIFYNLSNIISVHEFSAILASSYEYSVNLFLGFFKRWCFCYFMTFTLDKRLSDECHEIWSFIIFWISGFFISSCHFCVNWSNSIFSFRTCSLFHFFNLSYFTSFINFYIYLYRVSIFYFYQLLSVMLLLFSRVHFFSVTL